MNLHRMPTSKNGVVDPFTRIRTCGDDFGMWYSFEDGGWIMYMYNQAHLKMAVNIRDATFPLTQWPGELAVTLPDVHVEIHKAFGIRITRGKEPTDYMALT